MQGAEAVVPEAYSAYAARPWGGMQRRRWHFDGESRRIIHKNRSCHTFIVVIILQSTQTMILKYTTITPGSLFLRRCHLQAMMIV